MANFTTFPTSRIIPSIIPTQLNTGHEEMSSEAAVSSEHICPKCFANSRDQPIHCISVSSAPPPYVAAASRTPAPARPTVPVLNLQTSDESLDTDYLHRPAPAFRGDEERFRVRFRRNAFSPITPRTPEHHIHSSRYSQLGIGSLNPPIRPDASPITPGTVEKTGEAQTTEKAQHQAESPGGVFGASNLAQKIEQTLLRYSSSKNVYKRWLVEITSWIISALCMAGIIVILCVYQRKILPRWPLGFTINGIVSVFAKIGSAALIFPVSGALGQLKWNWFEAKDTESKESKKIWDFE